MQSSMDGISKDEVPYVLCVKLPLKDRGPQTTGVPVVSCLSQHTLSSIPDLQLSGPVYTDSSFPQLSQGDHPLAHSLLQSLRAGI